MVDLTPTAIGAASSATTSSGGGGAAGQGFHSAAAGVVNLPTNLQNLSQNVTLGARLVGVNTDGSVVLRTAQGDVTLNLPVNLQPGAQLQIQLQAGTPPSATLIYSGADAVQQAATNYAKSIVNNLPLPSFGEPTDSSSAAARVVLQPGAAVRALVLGNEFVPLATAPTESSLNAVLSKPGALTDLLEKIASGSGGDAAQEAQAKLLSQFGAPGRLPIQVNTPSLPARLLETLQQTVNLLQSQPGGAAGLSNDKNSLQVLQLAAQAQQQADGLLPPGVDRAQLPQGAWQQLAGSATGGATVLSPNSELNLKLLQIIPPGQSVPAQGGANGVVGQLTSQTINGQPVVQTPQGLLLLQAENKLSVGSTLIFETVVDSAARVAAQGGAAQAEAVKTNSALPKLEQALLALGQTDSEALRVILNSMPKMNGQFPASMLFFLQAMQTGDVRNWLGNRATLNLGAAGGAQMLEDLQKEFRAINNKAESAKPGEWRQITVPYLGEYGMATMRMAVRNHEQEIAPDERERRNLPRDAGRVTRFLFDVDYSEFGPLQVDGLYRPGANFRTQLDVLVRTRELLPNAMRRELMDLYSESLGAYGLMGALAFQAGYQNWVRLAEERGMGSGARV